MSIFFQIQVIMVFTHHFYEWVNGFLWNLYFWNCCDLEISKISLGSFYYVFENLPLKKLQLQTPKNRLLSFGWKNEIYIWTFPTISDKKYFFMNFCKIFADILISVYWCFRSNCLKREFFKKFNNILMLHDHPCICFVLFFGQTCSIRRNWKTKTPRAELICQLRTIFGPQTPFYYFRHMTSY